MESTYSQQQLSSAQQTEVRQQIGQWIYAMMSAMSKDEFLHILRTCLGKDGNECPSSLRPFKERFLHVKKLIQQLQRSTKSEKLIAIIGKPFLYKISLAENIDSTSGEVRMILELERNVMDVARVDVTSKITSKRDFDSYQNAISEAITYNEENCNGSAFPQMTFEQSIAEAALASQQEHFNKLLQQKTQREELMQQQQQRDRELATLAIKANQLCLETENEEGDDQEGVMNEEQDMACQEMVLQNRNGARVPKTDSKPEKMTKEQLREFHIKQAENRVAEAQFRATRNGKQR